MDSKHIIDKFGGALSLARHLGVDPSIVYKWTYPKKRGARIPQHRHKEIVEKAEELGIDITYKDFYE